MLRVGLSVWVLCLSPLMADEKDTTKPQKIPFEVYSGYFVSNKVKLDNETTWRIVSDKKSFDQLFGVASVMGDRAKRLKPNTFENQIVLTVIKTGKFLAKYKVQSIMATGSTLAVRYQVTKQGGGTATYTSPLIVSVPRKKWSSVIFVENGKTVKTLK